MDISRTYLKSFDIRYGYLVFLDSNPIGQNLESYIKLNDTITWSETFVMWI